MLATFSLAATPAPLPGFGPLRVGMSLEELRAATPGIEWKTGRPMKYSGQPTEYKADGVRIADLPFSAEVYARHHGAYGMTLEHASAALDADQCEQSARAVFAVIEPQTGPMEPSGLMIRGEESEPIGASSTVKLSQVLSMADYKAISRAKLQNRKPERRWLRANTPGSSEINGRPDVLDTGLSGATAASFAMDYQHEDGNESCRIRLTALRAADPPPPTVMDFNALRAAQNPSIARRHFELTRLAISVALPTGGVELNVRCRVDRDTGRTTNCQPNDAGNGGGAIAGLAPSPPKDRNGLEVPVVIGIGTPVPAGVGTQAAGGAGTPTSVGTGAPATASDGKPSVLTQVIPAATAAPTPPPAPLLSPEALASKARNTAGRLANAYQFDMGQVAGLDRDDPQAVLVDIPVRLNPADIRELRNTDQAVPVTQSGFRWATRAPAHILERLYPKRALRRGEQTNVALVCEVQTDLSAVCAPARQDPRPAPDFEWAALEILTYYRAEPKTFAGTPTPGIKFLQNLQFKLQ